MGLSRRILPSLPTNGSDCSHGCPEACPVGGCIASPPTIPLAAGGGGRGSLHLSNFIIAVGCFFATAIFLGLTYYAVLSHRRRRRRRPIPMAIGDGDGDDFENWFHQHTHHHHHHHHEWPVQTVGLDEAVIASISVQEYKEGLLGAAAADCSVCLGEFTDGELLRLLPKCGHAFHVPCIDTWLRSHVSCPLCRAHIAAAAPPEGNSAASDILENSALVSVEASGDGEVGGTEAGSEVLLDPSAFPPPQDPSDPPALLPSDLGEAGLHPAPLSEPPMVLVLPGASFPMVESGESSMEDEKDASFQEENSSKNKEKQESASKEAEKSVSGTGMGFFFSKNGRSRSSILPL